MNKIILLIVVAMATTQTFSQCACCAGAGLGSSNGDYNNGILTLPKHMLVTEIYADFRDIKNGTASEGDEKLLRSMFISSVGARYGITDKINVSALLPYVFLYTNSGNDKGIGDLILMGTYKVFSKSMFNIALQAGVELPTGVQKDSNFDNTTVIVGSGSYDPMFGVSFSEKWNKLSLQGSGLYKHTGKGFNDNYYGSLAVQNLVLSYSIKGENNFCAVNNTNTEKNEKSSNLDMENESNFGVNVFGGYYGEWLDKLKEDGIVDEDSGHYLGFVALGTNVTFKKWTFPLTLSVPIINNVYGEQNSAGFRLHLGIIKAL